VKHQNPLKDKGHTIVGLVVTIARPNPVLLQNRCLLCLLNRWT